MKQKLILLLSVILTLNALHAKANDVDLNFSSNLIFLSENTSSTDEEVRIALIKAYVTDNKVFLDWIVTGNFSADIFEVQKSYDGKKFVPAAIVFSSEDNNECTYQFFEKVNKHHIYRIKIIEKNGNIKYSETINLDIDNH
ncbi:MAG TPA: hypothetical protein PLU37_08260 [Chitinophagaceae bacterium]|nr:hypothetical protein [Chitinophagaceae bacterium]